MLSPTAAVRSLRVLVNNPATKSVTGIARRSIATSHIMTRNMLQNNMSASKCNQLRVGGGILHNNKQIIRTVFIQTLDTPNPESLKFVPSGKIVIESEDGNGYYVTRNDPSENILRSPLAKDLLKVDGIKAVYLGADFVTITKYAEYKWKLLRPVLLDKLMTFFDKDTPALLDSPEITDTTILDDDDEVVAMIKELIEARIRPAVQEDGGDIRYVGFDEETGVVTVQLAGSCVGCPSSSVTLKQGVENMLMHYIPEVTTVEALEEEEEGDGVEDNSEDATENKKMKSYEERLAAAGIPFSD